jgi:outer membrane biosynthesis protein TonB
VYQVGFQSYVVTDYRILATDYRFAVLRTLDNYITDEPTEDWLLEPVWRQIGRSPRFTKIFAASVVCHIIFYVTIVMWNWYAFRHQTPQLERQPELVKIADLAPPSDNKARLRSRTEAIERADTTKFQYDPNNENDVNLTRRSPKPTVAKGVETKLPPASQIENQINASRGNAGSGEVAKSSAASRPPETAPVNASRAPQPETTPAAQGIPAQNQSVPPAPKPSGNAANPSQQTAQSGKPQGDSVESAAFGFQAAQAQYLAYVRTKIRTKNEQIMPRYYIETLLANTVSTDFRLVLGRGGQILSTDLIRSCGYKQLDDVARQAIQLAKPFEGFPPNAGDTITLTVTVYYTPGR